MSEQENNTQETAPEKSRKNFGNTIVLFIVFFIIFTVLVTGVAFFADKIKGGSADKTAKEQQKENMTNPESGKQEAYVMNEKGSVEKQAEEAKIAEETKAPEQKPEAEPLQAPPAAHVKPEQPEKAPEPVKPAEPAKAEPVKAEAVKTDVKKEAAKPVEKPVVKEALKPVAVKAETAKPAAKETAKPEPVAESKITPVMPGDYLVQLASFRNFELAEEEYHRLSKKISDLQLVKVDLGEKGVWYRLRCSTALSKESAKARAAQITASTGYKPDIVKK